MLLIATLLSFVSILPPITAAHPSHRTAGAVHALPPIPTGPTGYPTTLSSVYSYTRSTGIAPNAAFQVFLTQIAYTTATVTVYEPWAAAPTSYPLTKVLTELSTVTYSERVVFGGTEPDYTSSSTAIVTAPRTWVLHAPPAPTDLPVGASLPSCDASCPPAGWTPDPRCEALGLDTACQGQCRQRDGVWWCYRRYRLEGPEVAMGRVCWGNQTLLGELLEPCVVTDHRVQCVPCKGENQNYASYTLLWWD
jgi:hypothetical protein